jgi:mRNA-degrading endonuclease toxin of MazEF toxin-antitoxin module
MNKSYIYVRGQVWYWEDPIYGRKERNESISSWDASVRFSRYVIVIQTTETINPLSVLAIPCSSGNRTPFDVQVPLSHAATHTDITYARTSLVFPAHPKCLQRYICTLSDSIMETIEDSILKLLAPSVANLITVEDFELIDTDKDKEEEQSIETAPEPDDPKQFRQSKWNDEKISAFLSLYKEGGMDAVCKAFNLKEGSVKKYYTQWSKQEIASTIEETDLDKKEDTNIPEIAATTTVVANRFDNIRIINNKESPYAVSKVSNLIKDALYQTPLMNEIKPYFKENTNITNDDFYKDLGSSIYYSLLDFLDIKKEYGAFVIPKVTPDYFNIRTWNFLDHVYYDPRLSIINSGAKMIETYRNYYKDPSDGIDREWIGVFRNRISTRFKISEFGINIICSKIQKLFCNRN